MTVLTLALILGSISVASAASGKVNLTDIADNANEEAIQVAYDLGIVTGTPEGAYEPEKAVNRAEFAALIVRALAIPESALASYSSTTFKDTSGYTWAVPYLAVLQQRGIMKGDGYGNAMPGRTISPNEAVTMVLRAIGYTDNASVLVGQWPANYVALGQNQTLYEKVASDTQMNKASAAQMIYNALTVQLVQVDANSTVSYLWDRLVDNEQAERTLLTTGLNCEADNNGHRKVVTFDDTVKSKINLVPKVGAYGIIYRSKADGEVVALTKVQTEFLAGRFYVENNGEGPVKFQSVDGTKYNLNDDAAWAKNVARDDYADVSTSQRAFFLNGDVIDLTQKQSDDNLYYNDGVIKDNVSSRLIIAAKVNGLTLTDLRSVAIWNASDHFLYEAGMVDGKKFNGHNFPLDANNERDDYGYVLAGIEKLDDIQADNVIYIYKNGNKDITRIDVGTETQSGAVTNVNLTGYTRTIGGETFVTAPWNGHGFDDVNKAGNEGTALLDIYHRVYDFQLGEAFKGNFAVLLDSADYFGNQVKIFDKTGNEVIYGVKDNITRTSYVDGATGNTVYDGIKDSGGAKAENDKLFEYKLSGGKISAIPQTATSGAAGTGHINPAGSVLSFSSSGTTPILIDSSVLVYVEDDGDYSLGSIKDLLDDDLDYDFQYIEKEGKVRALLVQDGDAGAQSVYVMINSISQGYDDGDIDVVTGLSFADGVANAADKTWNYNAADLQTTLTSGFQKPTEDSYKKGYYTTMVKFKIAEDGVLKDATDLKGKNNTDGGPTAIQNVVFGKYTSNTDGTFAISTTVSGSYMPIAFESNAVLYKIENGDWKAYRPTEGYLKADPDGTLYTFLRTGNDKKTYDVIIKQP
jgi:hypothetical protein